jgi:hypothetical protein
MTSFRRGVRGAVLVLIGAGVLVAVAALGYVSLVRPTAAPGSGDAQPRSVATPAPSATTQAVRTAAPTTGPILGVHVYFPRIGVPPIDAKVDVAGPVPDRAEGRILRRLSALRDNVRAADIPAGATNPIAAIKGRSEATTAGTTQTAFGLSAKVDGDLATVEFDIGGWGVASEAEARTLVQQLVYTITDEPGIRRAKVVERGKDHALILAGGTGAGVSWKDPLAREDVFGYGERGDLTTRPGFGDPGGAVRNATTSWSVDEVAPGLARFTVRLDQFSVSPASSHPDFNATLRLPTPADPPDAKWILEIQVFQVADAAAGVTAVDRSPLRSITRTAGKGPGAPAIYLLALDDARPWRTALAFEPVRIVVDVGGVPGTTSGQNAVYAPRPNDAVARSFTVSGVEHNFEAHVDMRVRDAAGRIVLQTSTTGTNCCDPGGIYEKRLDLPATVSGAVTLEVFEASARDGSDTKVIKIPLTIR